MRVADDDDDQIDDMDGELEVLPQVIIKIPLRVPPKLLALFCDVEQHQDNLRENVRNLIVQVGP